MSNCTQISASATAHHLETFFENTITCCDCSNRRPFTGSMSGVKCMCRSCQMQGTRRHQNLQCGYLMNRTWTQRGWSLLFLASFNMFKFKKRIDAKIMPMILQDFVILCTVHMRIYIYNCIYTLAASIPSRLNVYWCIYIYIHMNPQRKHPLT